MSNASMPPQELIFTGERYVPEVHGNIELEHLHRYLLASQLVADGTVLDIASGEGYGSALLARTALEVIGVDISQEAISHARAKYKAKNLEFRIGSCSAIPVGDACVDVVVSFETIEHHDEHEAMMREIKRVLKPGGVLVISSPDKYEYSDKPGYSNPYHVKELYRDEFRELLDLHFRNHSIYGQRVVYGSAIFCEDRPSRSISIELAGNTLTAVHGVPHAVYLVAIASDDDLPCLDGGVLEQPINDADIVRSLNQALSERDGQVDGLTYAVGVRDEQVAALTQAVAERDAQIASLAQAVSERDGRASLLNRLLAEKEQALATVAKTVESLIIDRDSQKAGLEQMQGSFEKLRQKKDSLKASLEEKDLKIEKLMTELSAVYKSKSWRVTAPLRGLIRSASKAVNYISKRHRPQLLTLVSERGIDSVAGASRIVVPEHDNQVYRILLVSYYCPSRSHAGGLRTLDIYALIRQQCPNVQLDLLTYLRPDIDGSIDDVYRIFHNVYLSSTEDLTPAGLTACCSPPSKYDVIDLQFHQTGYQIDAFRRIGSRIIFTPMESLAKSLLIDLRAMVSMQNGLRLFKIARSLRLAAEEIVFALKADEVVCVSRSDAAFLRAITLSRRIRAVDTGLSQFEFADALAPGYDWTRAAERPCRVLYLAYFGSETNVIALRWYLEHVHPHVKAHVPGYVFTVVGRGDLSAFANYCNDSSIEIIGEVPAIAQYIKQARVGIAPALGGSGFRGKVNQYAVLGVPCVVSPIAFKGLSYQEGINIFIAAKPEEFAERCIRLLTDTGLNDRMGQAARQRCMERYSWQSKWPAIRKIYKLEGIA